LLHAVATVTIGTNTNTGSPAQDWLQRVRSGYGVPSLSLIALRLMERASDDLCTQSELEQWIEKDPGFAVRLLRLANSVCFLTNYPATTIRQAIVRVGTRRLRTLALSVSLRETFPFAQVGVMDYRAFWHASLYRALLAKALAGSLPSCDPEEAFLAGLISEIGLLIFHDLFLRGAADTDTVPDFHDLPRLLPWETERFGVNHRQVGAAALGHWRFPEPLVACQCFPVPEDTAGAAPSLPTVCAAACELSALVLGKNPSWESTCRHLEERFGLGQDAVGEALASAFDQVQALAEGLEVEVDREKDMTELLLKANTTLSRLAGVAAAVFPQGSRDPLSAVGRSDVADATTRLAVQAALDAVQHEIRNPLTALGGFVRRLATRVDPGGREGKYLRIILQETQRLETVMQALSRGA